MTTNFSVNGYVLFTIKMSLDSFKKLEDLQSKIKADECQEVFKNALKLYDGIIDETLKGTKFYTQDSDGNFVEFKMFENVVE